MAKEKPQEFRHLSLPHMPRETYIGLTEWVAEFGDKCGCNPDHKYSPWILLVAFLYQVKDTDISEFARGVSAKVAERDSD